MTLAHLNPLVIAGKEVLPIIEGGKGVAVSNGESSGAWAKAGGIGTFSGVNADFTDETGQIVPQLYHGKTRRDRHEELLAYAVKGGIHQARVAHEIAGGNGLVHMNVLWEMGGSEHVLHGVLEGAKGLVNGVTCGAGMPYRIAEICAQYGVHYYPIVSSGRAFRALWLRAYKKFPEWLGAVVYEDPWLAGGHNGLSNSESPERPEDPYPRVKELRDVMNGFGLQNVPIVMAGGVWWLKEWSHFLNNPEIGLVAFQFGTRPLLTQESPISTAWKKRLMGLKKGDILLQKFSPTGFYSSAVKNPFLMDLIARSERQIPYTVENVGQHTAEYKVGPRGRPVFVTPSDRLRAEAWEKAGYTQVMKTPDNTMIFVTPDQGQTILADQVACMGCLSACQFSNWSQHGDGSTGRKADPRSFCIQKTLQTISHSDDCENQLMFAGHNAYRFADDPWYSGGFIPTVKELVDRIMTGE